METNNFTNVFKPIPDFPKTLLADDIMQKLKRILTMTPINSSTPL